MANPARSLGKFTGAILILVLLGACGDAGLSSPDRNTPPETVISGGPRPFSKSTYLVDLKWFGEDFDGEVLQFEIAWDDTTNWYEVGVTGSTFVVGSDSCCTFDTLETPAGADSVVERFFRFHTFYVRSIDDRGAHDPSPAFITFNSVTVAPSTRLTGGPRGGNLSSGTSVRFEWEGSDPDSPEYGVAAYEYYHATNGELRQVYGYLPTRDGGAGITRQIWDRLGWIRVSSDTTELVLRNLVPTAGEPDNKRHFFFVRAIDEAGAVEQIPVLNRNYTEWGVVEQPEGSLMIRSNTMGARSSGDSHPETGEVFEGSKLVFSWGADLRVYGGRVGGYSHAYDRRIWSPWDPSARRFPEAAGGFTPTRGDHVFFARVRDDAGLIIEAEFPFYVSGGPDPGGTAVMQWNDFFIESAPDFYPDPDDYLEFWADSLLASFNLIDQFNPRGHSTSIVSIIRRMSRASSLILTTDDWEGGGTHAALQHFQDKNPIWSYVDAGGNLLLLGFRPTWNFLPDNHFIETETGWDPDPCVPGRDYVSCGSRLIWYSPIVEDSIPHPLYEYCGLETTALNNHEDFLWSARSMQPEILPDLLADPDRSRFFTTGRGIHDCERFIYRDDRTVVPLFQFCRVPDPAVANGIGPCDGAEEPVGLFIPSNGKRGHVVILGMPLYYFEPEPAREVVEGILVSLFGETYETK